MLKGVTLACAIDQTQLAEPVPLDLELYQEWGMDRSLRRCRKEHGAQVMDGFVDSGERPRQVLFADEGGETLISGRKGDRHEMIVLPLGGSFAALTVINGETPPELPVHVLPGVGALRIEALTREGQPLGGLRFLLRYNGTIIPPAAIATKGFLQRRRATTTGPDGVLLLDQLPEGTYELWPFTTEPDIGAKPPLATVRVTPGETNVRLVVEAR
jgi:hypothetical protein